MKQVAMLAPVVFLLSSVAARAQDEAPDRAVIRRDLVELDGWNRSVLNSGRSLFDVLHRLGLEPTEKGPGGLEPL